MPSVFFRALPTAALLAMYGGVASGQGGSPSPGGFETIAPTGRQNFVVTRPGELRIVGDRNRYEIELPTDVLFDFDKSKLRPEAASLLDKLKEHFAKNPSSQVLVWGHTDSKGSDSHNFTLSQKRAKAVCDWMERHVGSRFKSCVGRGEQEPLLPNENPDGSDNPVNRQLNRRVTISVVVYPNAKEMIDAAKARAAPAFGAERRKAAPPP